MKGFNTGDGYMGLVDGKYILFASESDYYEYMNDQEFMDADERREALEDAGLDPDEFILGGTNK